MIKRKYRSFQPWFWYLVPAPVLIWLSKRQMNNTHVWYQEIEDRTVKWQLVLTKLAVAILLSLCPLSLYAHPGKTDANGCHQVSKNYIYQTGKVLKAGTEHCHATVGKMKFDDKTVLEDPPKKEKGKK